MNDQDAFTRTTRNRMRLADVLETLSDDQWQAHTLCAGWTVQHMAGHLLQPMMVGFGRFFIAALRHRGDADATVDHFARGLAARPRDELIRLLRHHAADEVRPPRVGLMGPFAETCVHLRDIARPLELEVDVPLVDWLALLDYLTSDNAAPALVAPGRLEGVSLTATDARWRWGQGREVRGTAEALAMVVTGRLAVTGELDGPGVPRLTSRL